MLDGGTNCGKGEQLWQPYMVRGTIGGAVFGPPGPLSARTTYGVTGARTKRQQFCRKFTVITSVTD